MTEPVRRVHYFSGQLLTPEDLQAEQDYHREMRYLHNRLLGQGVVYGLAVTVADGSTLVVGAGLAIDPWGRELLLADDVLVELGPTEPDGSRDLTLTWDQEPDSFVATTEDGVEEPVFTRWLERPRLTLGLPDEALPESVVLGQVQLLGGQVAAVDLGRRSTWRRAKPGRTRKKAGREHANEATLRQG